MPHKFHGWHNRKFTCFLKKTGCRLCPSSSATKIAWVVFLKESYQRAMCWWDVWPRRFAWASGKLHKLGKISTQAERSRKAESFHWKTALCDCVFRPSPTLSLSLSLHSYISGNKRKRTEGKYIFIHQRCCLSLQYSSHYRPQDLHLHRFLIFSGAH